VTTVDINPRLAAALLYASIGWPVLPLHTPDADGACDCHDPDRADPDKHAIGKHPRTMHGLADATTDEGQIRHWWGIWPHANIAVDLARAGLVDIAPDSIEWFAEFTARGLPPTSRFASGGGEGHAHYLYARPADCAVYRDTHTGEYDVLSNGYAVMPPSLHRSGRTYTWLEPSNGLVINQPRESAPRWSVDQLNARQQRTVAAPQVDGNEGGPPVDLRGEALERWHGQLFVAKPDGGVDRSYSLWRIACDLVEAGCARWLVVDCLADRDEALGWEKFSGRRDAQRRYQIITDRAISGMGPGRVRTESKASVTHQPAHTTVAIEWSTALEVEQLEEENVKWFVHGVAGAGLITELDGKAKQAGKTTLVLELVHAILHGEEFLGLATRYTPILYLTEQSGPSFKRNLSRAGLLDREDLHILFWNRAVGHKWDTIIAAARDKAHAVGAGLLVVDTLAQFSGIRGDDENKSGSAMQTMEPLQAATQDGLGILASRHDRKSGGEVGDSGRGSSAYVGVVDVVIHLQRLAGDTTGKEKQRVLESISRFEETPDKLLIEYQPGEEGNRSTFRALGDPVKIRTESLRIDILANLPTERGDAPDFDELRKDLGMREIDVRRVLNDLVREGLVEFFDKPRRYRQVVRDDPFD
jgi:hypothetical protein